MDWWMDAYQAGKAAGRKDGWLAGCNGGERRAGKAKWIMTMWGDRWDVQCCVACLPRPPHAAAAAPDRAAVGRRSVWTPLPSPAITASSDRETTSLLSPARSPLITVTPRMCCPRPHPPPPLQGSTDLQVFGSPPAATPPLLSSPLSPAPCELQASLHLKYVRLPLSSFAVVAWILSKLYLPLQELLFYFLKNGKRMKEETPQHPQRCPPQGGESSGGRGSRSAAGPSRCSAGWCYSLGAVKATKNRKYIYNNILSQSLPKHVPRVLKENEKNNNYSSIFPYPLLLVFLLLNLSSAPPWTDPCRISQTGQGRRWPG